MGTLALPRLGRTGHPVAVGPLTVHDALPLPVLGGPSQSGKATGVRVMNPCRCARRVVVPAHRNALLCWSRWSSHSLADRVAGSM